MKKKILNRIPRLSKKIFVIPNYVDTTSFCPNPSIKKEFDILFVGRLVEQKNIIGLLDSISVLNVKVMIVGAGELDSLIKNELKKSNCKISWLQNISNNSLPSLMNRSSIFILPSHYEGHPKTIIEAMACGMPVIGANSPGIKEIINHGHNGYLCETNSDSIKSAIEALLINPSMCQFLGKNARKYTVEKFSLDKIAKVEYEQYKTVLQN
jgi:glycosyltransferase involved in cell wall biosynthesis